VTDLVKLRRVAAVAGGADRAVLISAAADELESLRAEVARLRGFRLVDLGPQCTCHLPGRLAACPVHKEASL
jgi:hypothetical protein